MRIHSQLSLFGSNSQQLRVRVEADCRGRIRESMVGSLRKSGRERENERGGEEKGEGRERGRERWWEHVSEGVGLRGKE